uniref:Reverse transcriptase domain-containing protein n=1 Tax=Arcella intermedia TaxID=1963864 RepID=A0A6B2LR28_9EUKA
MVRAKDLITKIDIKDAFHHLRIHRAFRRFLAFTWESRVYWFKALPFGISQAPRWFTEMIKEVIGLLRSKGIRVTFYIDDIIIFHNNNTPEDYNKAVQTHKWVVDTYTESRGPWIDNRYRTNGVQHSSTIYHKP